VHADSEHGSGVEQMSIAELVSLEVFSVAKKPQKVSDSAAAIYVITQEDIRRSGATTIPDLLRMVPGMNVGQIDGSNWGISARGFNALFVDKLLVLMDGRSIYTPFFGGVFWNAQDTLLEDIDRIEVIRGPGATLWGANATNGVINIITKDASETNGTLVSGGAGTYQNGFAAVRHGANIGNTNARIYAKAFDRGPNKLATGEDSGDDWKSVRTGFRTDTELNRDDKVTVLGDFHYNETGWDAIERTLSGVVDGDAKNRYYHGFNLLGRWSHNFSNSSVLQLQSYYDHVDRDDAVLTQQRDTFDIEAQHSFSPIKNHELVYGMGFRFYRDDIGSSFTVSVDPDSRNIDLYTAFIQDEVTLIPNRLHLIGGIKLEHNAHSGFEFMPSVRMLSTPAKNQTIWAAVSRAVRSPARFNEDGRLVFDSFINPDNGLPTVVTGLGDRGFDGEDLLAYEIGYRTQIAQMASLDLALFFNDYDNLESFEPREPFVSSDANGTMFLEVPFAVENRLIGETYGAEITLDVRPTDTWRLVASYAYLNIDLKRTEGSQDTIFSAGEDQTPQSHLYVRSLLSLPNQLEFDVNFRMVSDVDTFDIDQYEELDLRLAWYPQDKLEIALVGQNLLNGEHLEFVSNLVDTERTEIVRGAYIKASYEF
jgi:iron complex outermembrane receptor protein